MKAPSELWTVARCLGDITVEFRNRRVYAYSGVPQNVYDGLRRAGSHGRYFNRWIKGRYRFRRQP